MLENTINGKTKLFCLLSFQWLVLVLVAQTKKERQISIVHFY